MKTKTFAFTNGFIKSITLEFNGNDSRALIVAASGLPDDDARFLHLKLRKIADMLDATPDDYEFNPGEIHDDNGDEVIVSHEYQDTLYWKKDGDIVRFNPLADPKHPITANGQTSVIGNISEEHLANVASKLLRELLYECFITLEDMQRAHTQLQLPHTALKYIAQRDEAISR